MKVFNKSEFRLSKLSVCVCSSLFLLSLSYSAEPASCSSSDGQTLICTVKGGIGSWGERIPSIMSGEYGLMNTYDFVEIDASGSAVAAGGVGPRGYGIYVDYSGVLTSKTLLITTNGSGADGIRVNKGEYDFTVAGKLTINSKGTSGDGINVANSNNAGSRVFITGEQAYIESKGGIGVRANLTSNARGNEVHLAKNATIVTLGTGSNTYAGTGYAVYAGDRNSDTVNTPLEDTARVFINDGSSIRTEGRNAYAVYANKTGEIQLGSTTISTSGASAHAIVAEDGTVTYSGTTKIYKGGQVYLTGDTNVSVTDPNSYAMFSSGDESFIGSKFKDGSAASGIFTINGSLVSQNLGVIDLAMVDGSHFIGTANSNEYDASGVPNTTTNGTVNLNISGSNSLWDMTADSVISRLTLTGATLRFASPTDPAAFTPKTLTIAGNYAGNGGNLVLNTVVGGDNSLSDRLIVAGDVDAGTTYVSIVNIGGGGDLTVEGIKIVEVGGRSIGDFVKQSRIVAGAYDYDVVKGASNENWYLSSKLPVVDPDPDPDSGPDPDPDPDPDPEPGGPNPDGENKYRPEFGSYLANSYAANTMFLTRLHDRLGETQYTDVLSGEQKVTSMWMRNVGGHTCFRDSHEQLKTKSNRYVLQVGGDLAQWSSDGFDRWHLGAMVGYGNTHSKTISDVTSHYSHGQVTGYSAGLYGTWYANEADKTGAYLDSWILYSWFDNKVMGEDRAAEKYKSSGVTASVEGGYSFKLSEKGLNSYWIQPKAQVVWMGVRAKDHYEQNDVAGGRTKVSDGTNGNLMTRLGVRAYMKGQSAQDEGKDRVFQPFIEANWIHNTQNYSVKMAGIKDEIRGTKNIGEVKVGIEGQLNKRLNLWGNVAQQVGDNGYSDTSAMLGVKYSF